MKFLGRLLQGALISGLLAGCSTASYPDMPAPLEVREFGDVTKGVDRRPASEGDLNSLVHKLDLAGHDLDARPDRVALRNEAQATLTYQLGPEDTDRPGQVFQTPIGKSLEEMLTTGDGYFHVRFVCIGCREEDNHQPEKLIEFDAWTAASNEVSFRFTPSKALRAGQIDSAHYSILLYKNGRHFETVTKAFCVVDLPEDIRRCDAIAPAQTQAGGFRFFSSPPKSDSPAGERISTRGARILDGADKTDSYPEIRLYAASKKSLNVDVRDYDLRLWLYEKYLPASEVSRITKPSHDTYSFAGNLADANINALTLSAYQKLSCLALTKADVEPPPRVGILDFWRVQRHELVTFLVGKFGSELCGPVDWKADQYTVRSRMNLIARDSVDGLAGREFSDFVDKLSEYAVARTGKRPLRLQSELGSVPVQFFHARNQNWKDVAAEPQFFGYLFDIAVDPPQNVSAKPPVVSEQSSFQFQNAVFAGFKADLPVDQDVSRSADILYENLKHRITTGGGKISPRMGTSRALQAALIEGAESVDLIWTYAHGDAQGSASVQTNRFEVLNPTSNLILGRTSLSDGQAYDRFGSRELGAIKAALIEHTGERWTGSPLVVLLACESGAPSMGGAGGRQLINEFFNLGAVAIVSTESEISRISAQNFGYYFLKYLSEHPGAGPSEAVWYARKELFRNFGDMQGMLVSYTGTHGPYVSVLR